MRWIVLPVAGAFLQACAGQPPAVLPSAQPSPCGVLRRQSSLELEVPLLVGGDPELNDRADRHNARVSLSLIALASERACVELGRYPNSMGELIRHGRKLPGNALCALRFSLGRDPWGNSFQYVLRNGIPELFSPGPDKRAHTGDDVTLQHPVESSVPIDARAQCRM